MNRCDSCGEEIEKGEFNHPACLKKLFGRPQMPGIDLRLDDVQRVAQESAGHLSISGMQPKISLALIRGQLTSVTHKGQYILKPPQTFKDIPENENLCMTLAAQLGILVPPHTLIKLKDGSPAYVVRRFDRTRKGEKIHCEDFAQIFGGDKYAGSFEQIGQKLREISDIPGLDSQYLFERVLFFYIIGNGDSHLKNFSVVHRNTGAIRLSPAYDIVSSRLAMPNEQSELALTLNGKKNDIKIKDIKEFGRQLGIRDKVLESMLNRLMKNNQLIGSLILTSRLPISAKKMLKNIIDERLNRINLS